MHVNEQNATKTNATSMQNTNTQNQIPEHTIKPQTQYFNTAFIGISDAYEIGTYICKHSFTNRECNVMSNLNEIHKLANNNMLCLVSQLADATNL